MLSGDSSTDPTSDQVAGEAVAAAAAQQHTLTVLTVNAFTAVPEPFHATAQRVRLPKLAQVLADLRDDATGQPYDVLVLTEVMCETAEVDLLQPLAEAGWPYATRRLHADQPSRRRNSLQYCSVLRAQMHYTRTQIQAHGPAGPQARGTQTPAHMCMYDHNPKECLPCRAGHSCHVTSRNRPGQT